MRNRTTRFDDDGARIVDHGMGRTVNISNTNGSGEEPTLGWSDLLRKAADTVERLEAERGVSFSGISASRGAGYRKDVLVYFDDFRSGEVVEEMDEQTKAELEELLGRPLDEPPLPSR